MSGTPAFARIQEAVGPLGACRIASDSRMEVEIGADRLLQAVTAFRRLDWGYLSAITGLDTPGQAAAAGSEAPAAVPAGSAAAAPAPNGHFDILYHFCEGPAGATFRVKVPRDRPVGPSIGAVVPSAPLFEREVHEMLGVEVEGLPQGRRQFLSDDWPEGVYPLRKDFSPDSAAPVAGTAPAAEPAVAGAAAPAQDRPGTT